MTSVWWVSADGITKYKLRESDDKHYYWDNC
jgi:hypothetical protein